MDFFEESAKIPSLNETNFQEFLSNNRNKVFVFETEDFNYQYYLPSHAQVGKGCTAEGKWMRQC